MVRLQRAINAGKIQGNVNWLKREGMLLFWAQSAEQVAQISEGKRCAIDAESEGIHSEEDCFLFVYHGYCLCKVELCFGTIGGQHSIGGDCTNNRPSSTVLEQAVGVAETMARPRERIPCRRGSGRGESSRPLQRMSTITAVAAIAT